MSKDERRRKLKEAFFEYLKEGDANEALPAVLSLLKTGVCASGISYDGLVEGVNATPGKESYEKDREKATVIWKCKRHQHEREKN